VSAVAERRLLLFHAHPDDETISTGATMARYVDEGVQVTLLTSTLGEEGEILVPALAQLAADQADQLGGYRIGELAEAMRVLGVTDHRYLGGPGRFRDSGMAGTPANRKPRALWRADQDPAVFDAAVAAAVDVIRQIRPQVVVSPDDNGDYGHPDHVMTYRVASAAIERAADASYDAVAAPPWRVSKVYWTAVPKSELARAVEALADSDTSFFSVDNVDELALGVADEEVTTALGNSGCGERKMAAMQAHATQISVEGPFFALSNKLGREIMAREWFRLVSGEVGGPLDDDGRETDLFAGTA
jgi:N-acetyl-1-D-myo-inositol-2-amino-2-deoxy-alpha-D-glucopyranoside deacetylase